MIDLTAYDVSLTRGFLPDTDPLDRLPARFEPWERLADQLSPLLAADRYRAAADRLPLLDPSTLTDGAELERAMLTLSFLGSAYVHADEQAPANELPRQLAEPWEAVAGRLGRPTIIAHPSYVLTNWRRIDPTGPVALGNLACQRTFLGGLDEQWFILVTAAIEATGAPALRAIVHGQDAVERQAIDEVGDALGTIARATTAITDVLERMYERCDPRGFFLRVRPYLASWVEPGVRFSGVSGPPRVLTGGSAAQSTLIQALDAGLRVVHSHPASQPFLLAMRGYMPLPHRALLERLEAGPSIRAFVDAERAHAPLLATHYDRCIDALDLFRKRHLEIAARYITRQAKDVAGAIGTGGTEFTTFLTTARRETSAQRIDPRPSGADAE
ncbi:MAG: PrnB family protein [Gemmatimonadales bacterium]